MRGYGHGYGNGHLDAIKAGRMRNRNVSVSRAGISVISIGRLINPWYCPDMIK